VAKTAIHTKAVTAIKSIRARRVSLEGVAGEDAVAR